MPSSGFIGTYEVSVYKQRFMLPTQFQKKLNAAAKSTFILTIGVNNTIACYSLDNWGIVTNKLENGTEDDQDFLNDMYDFASEQQLEGPGRLKISDDLMKLANIKDTIKIVGVGKHIVISNPEEIENRQKKIKDSIKNYPSRKWNV